MAQLHEYADLNEYNLSSVQAFLEHPRLRHQVMVVVVCTVVVARWRT